MAKALFTIVGAVIAIYVILMLVVYVLIPAVLVVLGSGAVVGGGHSALNYSKALRSSVEFERP